MNDSYRSWWLMLVFLVSWTASCGDDTRQGSTGIDRDATDAVLDADAPDADDSEVEVTEDPADEAVSDGTDEESDSPADLPQELADVPEELADAPDDLPANALLPRFEPEGEGFYRMPWPSDYRLDAEGNPDLADFPSADNVLARLYIDLIEEQVIGFSTNPVVYVGFNRSVSGGSLPAPAETLSGDSPVQLLDVTPAGCGERVPIELQFVEEGDGYEDDEF